MGFRLVGEEKGKWSCQRGGGKSHQKMKMWNPKKKFLPTLIIYIYNFSSFRGPKVLFFFFGK